MAAEVALRVVVGVVAVLGSVVVVRLVCATCGVWMPGTGEAFALFFAGMAALFMSSAIPDLASAARAQAAERKVEDGANG